MRAQVFACALLASVAGCVAAPEIKSTFNPAEAEFINETGPATLTGQAFLRQNDGALVYAAGSPVYLIPSTTYSRERMAAMYRGTKFNNSVPEPKATDPQYRTMVRETTADGEGRFEFSRIADGEYFIVTPVGWVASDVRQGGNIMEQVSIRDGQSQSIIMSGS